ncbi:hypothetical protein SARAHDANIELLE_16 [Hafnia phage vB_HpaM_SarahDanielle]|uniref:Uncharacterized protein n=1 Tax=Hafnia phage vB_HpaM_SarahDanielle TaxID=2836113 RepID=A0AAE7W9E1_9CAUD|nr:hypothetical protein SARAHDANIELLE_16 [Hafnia phage vB_HpaM_SarahDanielle]
MFPLTSVIYLEIVKMVNLFRLDGEHYKTLKNLCQHHLENFLRYLSQYCQVCNSASYEIILLLVTFVRY